MNHVPLHGCVGHSFFTFLSHGIGMRLWEQLLDVNGLKTLTSKSLDLFQVVHYTEKLIILPSSHAMPFSLLFSIDSRLHTLFACSSTVSTRIVHMDYARPLHRLSEVATQIICVGPRDYPQLSAQNHKFSVSHTIYPISSTLEDVMIFKPVPDTSFQSCNMDSMRFFECVTNSHSIYWFDFHFITDFNNHFEMSV